MRQHHCPECGSPIWGTACALCGYGLRPAPAPVRGQLLAGVCIILIIVVMLTAVIAANHGWFGF